MFAVMGSGSSASGGGDGRKPEAVCVDAPEQMGSPGPRVGQERSVRGQREGKGLGGGRRGKRTSSVTGLSSRLSRTNPGGNEGGSKGYLFTTKRSGRSVGGGGGSDRENDSSERKGERKRKRSSRTASE